MKSRLLVAAAATVMGLAPSAADASTGYPVEYHFVTGFLAGFLTPQQAPPGANDWSCRPSSAHPAPVVLVHGTFENMNDNWRGLSPLLADNGYCVFAFNYGGPAPGNPVQGTGRIEDSAGQLAAFVDEVLAATGAPKADLVGHSQGGMMPRYYLKNLGGAAKVGRLVGLAPSNHGTTLDGLSQLAQQLGLLEPTSDFLAMPCVACVEQEQNSPFIAALNAGGETLPGVSYTVIASRQDEVVTPYTSALLDGATNLTVQDQCPLDAADHVEIAYDPVALTDVLNALDPANPRPVLCELVLPVAGPVL